MSIIPSIMTAPAGVGGEDTAEQLRRVQAVTDAALAHLTLDRLLDELLARTRELLDADTAAVLLLEEGARTLVATAAKGLEEEVEYRVQVPLGVGFAGKIAATAAPVILEEVDATRVHNTILVEKGIRSLMGVPLVNEGRVIGVLHCGTLTPRKFTEDDVRLLQLVADRVALAVRARVQEGERVTTEILQRSLLPERLPALDDFEVSARYVAAQGGMVGGDWYDVFLLPSGALCVVVGDVAGRGLPAATVMARLRNGARAYALEHHSPEGVLGKLNDLMMHFEPDEMATMIVAIVEPGGRVAFANAGHMPALLIDAGRRATFIEHTPQPALGAAKGITYRGQRLDVEPGSSIVLYTDGLVERRGESLTDGLGRLRAEAGSEGWTSLHDLCRNVMASGSGGAHEDDVAVLAMRYRPVARPTELRLLLDASPEQLGLLRRRARGWLGPGVHPQDAQDVLVAMCEAVANAMEHAYGPGRGLVELSGDLDGNEVVVHVHDQGRWRAPRGEDRGRGLTLIKSLMDEVDVESDRLGTTVVMRKTLRGAVEATG